MAVSPRKVKNKRDANGNLTGRAGTVYDVIIKYKTPTGEKFTYSKKGFLTKKEAGAHMATIKTSSKLLPMQQRLRPSENRRSRIIWTNSWKAMRG